MVDFNFKLFSYKKIRVSRHIYLGEMIDRKLGNINIVHVKKYEKISNNNIPCW